MIHLITEEYLFYVLKMYDKDKKFILQGARVIILEDGSRMLEFTTKEIKK
jgi:hypothetical protein